MNYTQKKSSCETNSTHIIDNSQISYNTSHNFNKSIEKHQEKSSAFSDVDDALLVNTELHCRISSRSPKEWENALPNYVKKFIRKHTAVYCMATD